MHQPGVVVAANGFDWDNPGGDRRSGHTDPAILDESLNRPSAGMKRLGPLSLMAGD